jgi:hypothetical protein
MRIAVTSTPRSGNTWVRGVLRDALDLEELAVHNYLDLPDVLPERVVLQIHWYREPNFQKFLRDNGFRIVVLGRHPLDVLLSVLHYVRHEPLTTRWLEGNVELPDDFSAETPYSEGFRTYATSWGAENLLSISYQWWLDRDAIRVRYEDLVQEPRDVFSGLIHQLGGHPGKLDQVIASHPLSLYKATPNRQGWQGMPGLWRQLILPSFARQIRHRHERVFETLGYHLRPYILTRRQAERNWIRLAD